MGLMNRIQDSVVQGNVAGRDITYVTNTSESGRVECPNCRTSGMITIYHCNSCNRKICDTCRVNGCFCQNCIAFQQQQKQQHQQQKQQQIKNKQNKQAKVVWIILGGVFLLMIVFVGFSL